MSVIFKTRFKKILVECLANSLDNRMINKLGKKIEPNFNLHMISGISEKITIQSMDAARTFVDYFFSQDKQFKLISEIINSQFFGIDGYPITIYNSNLLLDELKKLGYIYDKIKRKIIRLDKNKSLVNWGFLEDNEDHHFCFISIDIVENSKIVRKNKPEKIAETYKIFYELLRNAIINRDGRIWLWEGDGGIIAFIGNKAINRAVYAILDFVLNLPVYNAIYNKLNEEIIFRVAIHPGNVTFKNEINQIKSPTLDKLLEIEKKHTTPGNIVISKPAWQSLSPGIQALFKPIEDAEMSGLYSLDYQIGRKP